MKRLSCLDGVVSIVMMFCILTYPTLMVAASDQRVEPGVDVSNAQSSTVATAAEILHVITTENVTMLDDGRSLVTLLTVVPPSPLADVYRKSLGVPTPADGELQISGKKTEIVDIVGNATEIGVPNRESFYRGIEQEQSFFLGRILGIFDSRVVSGGGIDDFRVSVSAFASLQVADYAVVGSDAMWEIGIGPMDHEAIHALTGFVFSKITFIQMMLMSLEGQQIYDYTWITRIHLPPNGTLLNRDKLDGLNWEIDFGGGTSMVAFVSIDETSTVILNERTFVSENDITTTPELLLEDFSTYKTFNLRCQLPRSASIHSEPPTSADVWSYSWDYPLWSQSIELTFSQGPLSATLTVTPSLTISGYVGWDFDLGGLNWFEAWMSVTASINVEFEATATESYSYTFQHALFEWKTIYSFWVGPVPVWADMQFTSSASLTIGAYAKISFYAQAEAQATFKAGVKWTRSNGWSGISEVTTSASKTGPNISAEAGASVRPAIQFRLAFLFYGVAGPFVECETYVNAAITYVLPNGSWEVSVNFRIVAGSTFAEWLKTLLGLDDWSTVIYERQLASWSGTWGPSSISISETLNPSTVLTYGSVQVYGTATFSGGSPVSLTDVIMTITQTGRRWTTTTDNSGYYSEYISAPPSAGAYSVKVEITSGSTSGSNSQPLTVQSRSGGGTYSFYRSTTCKGVQGSSPYDPIDETEAFRTSDFGAYTWIHLTYIYRSLNVKWEWYKPDGGFYSDYTSVIPDPGSQGYDYWEWYKCWGYIYINGYAAQDIEGRWTSKVYIDEGSGYQLKAIEDFVIRYDVTRRTMAKDVQPVSPYEPINPTNLFLNTDPKALGWIGLDEVAEQLEVKWEWYDPSGALYYTFPYTVPDPSSQGYAYWDWYVFWGYINIYGSQAQSKLGQWTMKAYIKDVYGSWDLEYSEYFTISDNTPPGAPGTPVDDGVYSTSGTATWTWTAASEEGEVVQYQIQVGTTPGGSDVYDGYVGTSLSETLSSLASGHTYYARVRAMNQPGQWGPWSGVSDGITVDRPPMTLITSGPEENIDYVDVCFNWTGTDDITPISSLVYSYYLVGYDSDWSPFTSSTSKQYYGLPDDTYTFKVRAKDSLGSMDPSPAEVSFTIKRFIILESREDTGTTANLGTITIDGTLYSLPSNISKAVGTYQVQYDPSLGYAFNHWETVGGVDLENLTTNPTTVTISGVGTLRAIYKEVVVTYTIHLESGQDNGASSNLGTTKFDGLTYSLPNDITKTAGTYQIEYSAVLEYKFDHWETAGGVAVASSTNNPTTATIGGDGTLRAIYAQTNVIFEDDFESYTVGTKPTPPWEFWFNQNGKIVNTTYVSPTKSLWLLGANGWGVVAAKPITINTDTIGYKVMVKAENWGLAGKTGGGVSFARKISGGIWTSWASVVFRSDGYISTGGQILQPYDLNTWYQIVTIFTISSRTYSVWIDGQFKEEFLDTNPRDPSEIQALSLSSDHAEQVCYFDDVKVYGFRLHTVHNLDTGINYSTIQAAIDDPRTLDGHTIFVAQGVYYEHVVVSKSLSLVGKDRDTTIIDGNLTGTVIRIVASNVNITGFTIQNSGTSLRYSYYGIYVSSNGTNISHNIITNNSFGIYFYYSSNNFISGNNIIANTRNGIRLYYSSNNIVSENMFIKNGLFVSESYGNVVNDNFVNGKLLVYLEGVSDCTVQNAGQVILVNCNSMRVENLDLSNADVGVELWRTNNTEITESNITGNIIGIYVSGSSSDTIRANNITANRQIGIELVSSSNIIVYGNNITNNGYNPPPRGIIGGIYSYHSSNNTIYHNNFVSNARQIYTYNSVNVWDDGYPSGGNYWSDYADVDLYSGSYQNETGSDGMGDTPYIIDANNQDQYPLMKPWPTKTVETKVRIAGKDYPITIESNATITHADATRSTLHFTTSGPTGTTGYINVTFPIGLNTTEIKVFIDGVPKLPNVTSNGTHYFIYFEFTLSTHNIAIQYSIVDVATTNITPAKTIVGQGYTIRINATIQNKGDNTETFNITLYANTTAIATQTVTLTSGNFTTITFTWNTAGFAKGNYTIKAYAWPVTGENDTSDNTLADGWVVVTIPGDIDGSFRVDGGDLGLLGLAWYSKPGDPNWNPNADINNDGLVDGGDLGILGFYWFQTSP